MISRAKLIALYSAMVKYRQLAEHIEQLAELRKLPLAWRLTPGLEATVAAITADLRRDDSFAAAESRLASVFVDRSVLKDLVNPAKGAPSRNGRVSPTALARGLSAAVKTAEALKTSKGDTVSLVFCETRLKADVWRQQLQRAGRNNLPVILVRLVSASRRAHVAPDALAFGVPRIAVDANDVLAVYRVASESIARARHRRGPTLIECLHGSRGASDEAATDSLHAIEVVLARKRIVNKALKQKIATVVRSELSKALRQLTS